jgi:FlaG/FlaF family flagellin (archaellin)
MFKIKKNNKAVSEVLGTILLLGISVSLFSVIYISVFSVDAQPPTPTVDIMGTIHKNYLVLEHGGGEDIDAEFQIILRYNVGSSFVLTSDDIDGNFDGKWNIGEKLKFNLSDKLVDYTEFSPIDIMVVDAQSNSAVMMGTLKESPEPPEPPKYADVGIDDIYCTPNNVSENASEVTLYFEVKNYGDKPATGFNYTILIDGAEFAVDVSHDFSSQQNEESVTIPITLPNSYPQNMPSYNITVEISQYDSDGPDNYINNNIETTWVDFFEEEQYIPEADLVMIVKPVSEAPAYCFYDRFNFGVVVQNQGPDPINNVEVEISHNLVGTGIFWVDQGTYNPDTGKWSIGNLNPSIQHDLKIDTFIEPMPSEVEFTQFAIVIDGSNTIIPDKFQMALQGICNAIIDGSIPRNGQIELTIIQFGQTTTIPSYLTRVELPPTIINNNIGTPGYYQNIAEIVANIKKMGGQYSPFPQAIQNTTEVLKSSPNFNSNNVQIINFITDGQIFNLVPGGGHQCFELENGTIICIVDDIVYPEGSDSTLYLEAIQKRNEMISELGLTSDKDQINVLAIEGEQGLNLVWLQNEFVWPQPGHIWESSSVVPPSSGWLRIVDTSFKVRNCLGYQINYINIQARTVEAEIISYSGAIDPDESNNSYSLTITPQKRKFT